MFTIRQQHETAFQESLDAPVVERIIATLKDSLPEETEHLSAEKLSEICDAGLKSAILFGIEKERNICFLIAASILLNGKINAGECARYFSNILTHPDFDEDAKGFFILKGIIQFTDKEPEVNNG